MSDQATASVLAAPLARRDRPRVTEAVTIIAVVALTVAGVIVVFKALGPNVRPASTPFGWSGVYGDDFALALPNDFGTSTAPGDLATFDTQGVQMVAVKDGPDARYPDAAVLIVTQPGTAAGFATSVAEKGNPVTSTTLTTGDALTTDATVDGAAARVWFFERGDHAWAVMVLVRNGGPYSLDDLGTNIANSFDAL